MIKKILAVLSALSIVLINLPLVALVLSNTTNENMRVEIYTVKGPSNGGNLLPAAGGQLPAYGCLKYDFKKTKTPYPGMLKAVIYYPDPQKKGKTKSYTFNLDPDVGKQLRLDKKGNLMTSLGTGGCT